jgi:hypothetical protein
MTRAGSRQGLPWRFVFHLGSQHGRCLQGNVAVGQFPHTSAFPRQYNLTNALHWSLFFLEEKAGEDWESYKTVLLRLSRSVRQTDTITVFRLSAGLYWILGQVYFTSSNSIFTCQCHITIAPCSIHLRLSDVLIRWTCGRSLWIVK